MVRIDVKSLKVGSPGPIPPSTEYFAEDLNLKFGLRMNSKFSGYCQFFAQKQLFEVFVSYYNQLRL